MRDFYFCADFCLYVIFIFWGFFGHVLFQLFWFFLSGIPDIILIFSTDNLLVAKYLLFNECYKCVSIEKFHN